MSKKNNILIFLIIGINIVVQAQDTSKTKKNENNFYFGVSIGAFYTPKIVSPGVYYNQKKLSYNISGDVSYKLNKRISINSNIEFKFLSFKFKHTMIDRDPFTGLLINDSVTYSINNMRLINSTYLTYNFIYKKRFTINALVGASLLIIGHNYKLNEEVINGYPIVFMTANSFNKDFSLLSGLGASYFISKNNIIALNCIYKYNLVKHDFLVYWDPETFLIDKKNVLLNLSYYFKL